jgi:hypothetical protein
MAPVLRCQYGGWPDYPNLNTSDRQMGPMYQWRLAWARGVLNWEAVHKTDLDAAIDAIKEIPPFYPITVLIFLVYFCHAT